MYKFFCPNLRSYKDFLKVTKHACLYPKQKSFGWEPSEHSLEVKYISTTHRNVWVQVGWSNIGPAATGPANLFLWHCIGNLNPLFGVDWQTQPIVLPAVAYTCKVKWCMDGKASSIYKPLKHSSSISTPHYIMHTFPTLHKQMDNTHTCKIYNL